jgi:hypothetical protein
MNFCAAFRVARRRVVWWALTPSEEDVLGFDSLVRAGRTSFVFQFKAASGKAGNERRFKANYRQMTLLANLAAGRQGSVFYVLPNVSTWEEFQASGSRILRLAWFLDVADIPRPISVPTTIQAPIRPRADESHYFYLAPPWVTMRSEPVRLPVTQRSSADAFKGITDPDLLIGWAGEYREALYESSGKRSRRPGTATTAIAVIL